VCGIPDKFYTDHGSDFTSRHLEQVAADLHMALVFSIAGKPRGAWESGADVCDGQQALPMPSARLHATWLASGSSGAQPART
jgi:hypothetical protein